MFGEELYGEIEFRRVCGCDDDLDYVLLKHSTILSVI